MESHNTHGGLCRLSYARCAGWKARGCSNARRAISHSIAVSAKEASKLPDYGKRWPRSSWQMRRKIGQGKEGASSLDLEGQTAHQICSFMWADNFWIVSLCEKSPEQVLRDLNQEAEKWGLAPKPSSLWSTSTFDSEEKSDLSEENCKFLGCILSRQGKAHEGIEERMQSANRACWRDVKIYRSKDVPWRVKGRRMVEHVLQRFFLLRK